ncbi:MAG: hypothetical protein P1V97_38140, partial [Planctomycetota bacterium]|nr:hypothetical protein [Planctomycetota bacterium]
KLFKLTTENEGRDLAIGRPLGVPFGRFNDNDLKVYEGEVALEKATFYMKLKDWHLAERYSLEAFEKLKDKSSANTRLDILKELNSVKEIEELQKEIIHISKIDPEKRLSFKNLIQEIKDLLHVLEQK